LSFRHSISRWPRPIRTGTAKVSFAEYAAHRLRMFRAGFDLLDANNGTLAWNLFRFMGQQPDIAPFQELGRNGDGKVAWTEFLA
jgi:hypothetical protein